MFYSRNLLRNVISIFLLWTFTSKLVAPIDSSIIVDENGVIVTFPVYYVINTSVITYYTSSASTTKYTTHYEIGYIVSTRYIALTNSDAFRTTLSTMLTTSTDTDGVKIEETTYFVGMPESDIVSTFFTPWTGTMVTLLSSDVVSQVTIYYVGTPTENVSNLYTPWSGLYTTTINTQISTSVGSSGWWFGTWMITIYNVETPYIEVTSVAFSAWSNGYSSTLSVVTATITDFDNNVSIETIYYVGAPSYNSISFVTMGWQYTSSETWLTSYTTITDENGDMTTVTIYTIAMPDNQPATTTYFTWSGNTALTLSTAILTTTNTNGFVYTETTYYVETPNFDETVTQFFTVNCDSISTYSTVYMTYPIGYYDITITNYYVYVPFPTTLSTSPTTNGNIIISFVTVTISGEIIVERSTFYVSTQTVTLDTINFTHWGKTTSQTI